MLRLNHYSLLLPCLLLLTACNEAGWESDGNSGGGSDSDRSFFGPGDFWELGLEDEGTFTLTRKDAISDSIPQINVEGNYEKLQTGFTRFTMTNTESGINSSFAGLEVSSELVLLAPVEAASRQITALVDDGSCPSGTLNGGWIKYRFNNAANTGSDDQQYFGIWRYNPGSSDGATFSFREDYSLSDMQTSFGGEFRESGECDNGLAINSEYSDYLSSAYAIANIDKDVAANNEYVLGFPTTAITSSQEYNGNYVGFMYQSESNFFATVSASCTDGTCQIYDVTDINLVNFSSQIFTLTLSASVDAPEQGFVTGQLQNQTSQVSNIACGVVLNVNTADNDFLACVGQFPAAIISDAVNFFLLSTD